MTKCPCGQALPVHLAKLGLTGHVCSCERQYKTVDGEFVADGTTPNPFARLDAAEVKDRNARRPT